MYVAKEAMSWLPRQFIHQPDVRTVGLLPIAKTTVSITFPYWTLDGLKTQNTKLRQVLPSRSLTWDLQVVHAVIDTPNEFAACFAIWTTTNTGRTDPLATLAL